MGSLRGGGSFLGKLISAVCAEAGAHGKLGCALGTADYLVYLISFGFKGGDVNEGLVYVSADLFNVRCGSILMAVVVSLAKLGIVHGECFLLSCDLTRKGGGVAGVSQFVGNCLSSL